MKLLLQTMLCLVLLLQGAVSATPMQCGDVELTPPCHGEVTLAQAGSLGCDQGCEHCPGVASSLPSQVHSFSLTQQAAPVAPIDAAHTPLLYSSIDYPP